MAAINAQFTSRICQTLRGQVHASLHIRFNLVRGLKPCENVKRRKLPTAHFIRLVYGLSVM